MTRSVENANSGRIAFEWLIGKCIRLINFHRGANSLSKNKNGVDDATPGRTSQTHRD
jgi:hypothetical protein